MVRRGEFYEDDEPVEKLEVAFDQGRQVVSATSSGGTFGWNAQITVTGVKPTPPAGLGKTKAALINCTYWVPGGQ